MKKLLAAILVIGATGWVHADIAVTQGSGKTVGTFTDANSREIQQVSTYIAGSSNTVIVSTLGVIGIDGTSRHVGYDAQASSLPVNVLNTVTATISGTVQPGNTPNTTAWLVNTSTLGVIGIDGTSRGAGYSAQSSSVPVNVLNTLTVNTHAVTQSGVFNINGSVVVSSFAATSTPMVNMTQIGTSTIKTSSLAGQQSVSTYIDASSNTVIVSTFGIIGIDGTSRHVGYDAQASSVPVNVLNTPTVNPGNTANTVPWLVNVTTLSVISNAGASVPIGYSAQSSSLPVNIIEIPDLGILKWSTATITTNTAERVLISSAGTGLFNNVCGCVVTNTSATNANVTFRRSGPLAVDIEQILIGAPANSVPAGVWPGCANPFYRSGSNSNVTVQGSASVTSLEIRCQYFIGT